MQTGGSEGEIRGTGEREGVGNNDCLIFCASHSFCDNIVILWFVFISCFVLIIFGEADSSSVFKSSRFLEKGFIPERRATFQLRSAPIPLSLQPMQ